MNKPKIKLSDIHDCDKCHGKIVLISVDKVGITRCGYCNEIVDYREYHKQMMNCLFGKHGKKVANNG